MPSMMKLRLFLAALTVDGRDAFARRCGSTRGHLQNIMYGLRVCAAELAVAIELETSGAVRRWDLRPNDWHRIWPELIGQPGAPDVPADKAVANA